MSIHSDKSLGGIGSILVTLGALSSILNIITYAFQLPTIVSLGFSLANGLLGLLNLLGWILFLVAMHTFSKHYNERRIFDYILYGVIATIVAGVIGIMALVMFALGTAWSSSTELLSSMSPSAVIFGFVALIYLAFAVTALKLLGAKSQVPLFNTAIKVFLAGAAVQIIMGIAFVVWASTNSVSLTQFSIVAAPGGLIQYIGWAVLAKAFFRITPTPIEMTASQTVYPAASAAAGQTKYCIHCGAANSPDMIYCVKCGKKQ